MGSSIDNGDNNEDKFGSSQQQQALRRMPGSGSGTQLDSTQPETSQVATVQDDNQDSDLESIDESELQPQTQREKSVTFHLPRHKPTVLVFKPRWTRRATRV